MLATPLEGGQAIGTLKIAGNQCKFPFDPSCSSDGRNPFRFLVLVISNAMVKKPF